jgi:hypothetical protein
MIDSPRTAATVLGTEPAAGEAEPFSDGPSTPLDVPPRRRGPRRRASSPWWRFGFPLALVALVAAIPVLVWLGAKVVLDSNDGRLVSRVTDPTAPGWEAVVEPTPTDLVLTIGPDDQLQGVSLLVLTGDGSGGVLQIPAETLVSIEAADGATTEIGLGFEWIVNGADGVRARVGELLNLSISDAQVITPDRWAELVEPVSPLTINSPDAAVDGNGQVVFPRGSIQITADEVSSYLSTVGRNQSDLSRLVRVEAFWRAWLAATGAEGPSAVPPPSDQGLGLFVGTLGREQVRIETLPVSAVPNPNGGPDVYRPLPDEVRAVVAELVPFPRGAPGARPTVEVLDGTGRLDHGSAAAVLVGAAGGQVDVIGNAPEFGVATTEIIYYDDARRTDAEALRQALGVGEVVKSNQKNAIDITVVLGDDALLLEGASPRAPDTMGEPADG